MNPSPQQTAFVNACASTTESLTLDSVPGSGKTTTLVLGSHKLAGQGMSTSFSKATVTELGKAMSSSFPARTMHGAGLDACRASLGKPTIDKANNKVFTFVQAALKETDLPWHASQSILQLVDQAQTAGIVPGRDKFLLADEPANWEALADQYDIEYNPLIQSIARRALIHSNTQAIENKVLSFNDMLYIPLFFPMRVKQHKTIIVDEAQDLSPIQHALLRKQLRPGGRIIAAGDVHQAIYGFRGALTNSYDELVRTFSAKRLQLTVSFRCSQAVVQAAKQYVPEIESAPGAPIGDVIEHNHLELAKIPRAVLCRNNAPLVKLALRLLLQGITAEVAGKDIGAGLISLTKRLATGKQSDHMKSEDFFSRVQKWADREIARRPRAKPAIQDKLMVFEALCVRHSTLGAIRHHLKTLYVNPGDNRRKPAQIHLTTIHKAKGREWPEVLFLDPHLIPAKWAEQDWELQQEKNLAYVGITRAQQILHYCDSRAIN